MLVLTRRAERFVVTVRSRSELVSFVAAAGGCGVGGGLRVAGGSRASAAGVAPSRAAAPPLAAGPAGARRAPASAASRYAPRAHTLLPLTLYVS